MIYKTFTINIALMLILTFALACAKGEEMSSDNNNRNYVQREKDALKEKLTRKQYKVVCENDTERAFNNEYWDNKRKGIYVDIVSKVPLFTSKDKFDSKTGWPSFTSPIHKEYVWEKEDRSLGITRREVRSSYSGAHLGHVFDDGPIDEGGLRYCINSASLKFIPIEEMKEKGYGAYLNLFPEYETKSKLAAFAAGCFWGVEEYFSRVEGVLNVRSGYTGGKALNPTYKIVSKGDSGHAEACEIEYDPNVISYEKLLKHFFKIHNPTQVNGQAFDIGTQYRSAIFYYNDRQKEKALSMIMELNKSGKYEKEIATEIAKADAFYIAEEYHQNYLKKNPNGYCHVDLSDTDIE